MFQARIPGPAMRAPTTSGVATTTVDMRPETIIRENLVSYVCPSCHKPLDKPHCGAPYAVENGIADFSGGAYYDTFSIEDELTAEHKIGLAAEITGSRWRIERFYIPMLERGARPSKVSARSISLAP